MTLQSSFIKDYPIIGVKSECQVQLLAGKESFCFFRSKLNYENLEIPRIQARYFEIDSEKDLFFLLWMKLKEPNSIVYYYLQLH